MSIEAVQKQAPRKLMREFLPVESISPQHLSMLVACLNNAVLKIPEVSPKNPAPEKGFEVLAVDDREYIAYIGSISERTFLNWVEAIGNNNTSPVKTNAGRLKDHEIESLRTRFVFVRQVSREFLDTHKIPYRPTPTIAKINRRSLQRNF